MRLDNKDRSKGQFDRIHHYLKNNSPCFSNMSELSRYFGISTGRIKGIISKLEEENFIKVERNGRQLRKITYIDQ